MCSNGGGVGRLSRAMAFRCRLRLTRPTATRSETTPITPRATPSPIPTVAPVERLPPVAEEGSDVDDVEAVLAAVEEAFPASVADVVGVDEEETKLPVLAASLMTHPTTPMAPTVDELTVSVLVVTVQLEPPLVWAHVPL